MNGPLEMVGDDADACRDGVCDVAAPAADGRVHVVRTMSQDAAAPYDLLVREAARLAPAADGPFVVVRRCHTCGSEAHGKPYLVTPAGGAAPVHVSLSRAGGTVLVAVSDAGPVGVDIEEAGAAGFDGFDGVVLHASEQTGSDPTTVWVRKESLLKATGHGLYLDPRRVAVSAPGAAPTLDRWPDDEPAPGPVWMFDLDVGTGFVAVVSVLAPARPTLVSGPAAPGD